MNDGHRPESFNVHPRPNIGNSAHKTDVYDNDPLSGYSNDMNKEIEFVERNGLEWFDHYDLVEEVEAVKDRYETPQLEALEREGISQTERDKKATKADDASVPEHLWEAFILDEGQAFILDEGPLWWRNLSLDLFCKGCNGLRGLLLCNWKRNITRSLWGSLRNNDIKCDGELVVWLNDRYVWSSDGPNRYSTWQQRVRNEYLRDLEVGAEAVKRAANSSWWKWDDGSTLFFWRWPSESRVKARDGLPIYFKREPPKYFKAQQDIKDTHVKSRVQEKLDKVRRLGYIGPGDVKSLTAFFAVPKGEVDIRMVYDGTISGLNDSMWVPRFILPTVRTMLRAVVGYTFMVDADAGDFFLNFNLHSSIRVYAGVDLTHYDKQNCQGQDTVHKVWKRAGMGLKSLPFQAVQMMALAEEEI